VRGSIEISFSIAAEGETLYCCVISSTIVNTVDEVVDEFSRIIQSGKPVILDGRCEIKVVVYEPPPDWIDSDDETEI
jgi:hypothetical protein